MRPAWAVVWLATMMLPAGCAATAGPVAPHGTVTGRLVFDAEPMGLGGRQPGPRPIPGTVQFTDGHHRRITVHVTSSGRFSVQLPAGRYAVSDRSPRIGQEGTDGAVHQTWSHAEPVTVTPHHTTKITVALVAP